MRGDDQSWGVLGRARFERGYQCFRLLNDGEQVDDQQAYDERCPFPTGGI
jgi:hypothetical protein